MFLSYLGLFLLGGTLISIGIFTSVLTRSQMLAAVLCFVITITLWFLADIGGEIGHKISLISHIESFSLGVIDSVDLAYYLFMIGIFLFLTVRVLEAERWK